MTILTDYKLKYLRSLFSPDDNEYRELIECYYNNIDVDEHLVPYTFLAHENIINFNLPINKDFLSDPWKFFEYTLSNYTIKSVAENDIKLELNKQQLTYINERDDIIEYCSCPDRDNNFTKEKQQVKVSNLELTDKRYLVLYFRRESFNESENIVHNVQVDYFEFSLICYILNKLIESDKNSVFTGIKIVSRESGLYPQYIHKLVPKIKYCDVTGEEFVKTTSIYANCVYFVNGSVPCHGSGSLPVFCNGMLLQTELLNTNHIHYDLSYNKNNNDDYVMYNNDIVDISTAYKLSNHCQDHDLDSIVYKTINMYNTLVEELTKTII